LLEFAELVAFVASTDLARARRFYEGVLGLRVAKQGSFDCELRAGGTTVRLTLVEQHQPVRSAVLGWAVPDIASTLDSLAAVGVAEERYGDLDQDESGIWRTVDGSQMAWFKDPDGNVLCLTQS
jgi:catechol 2,3-dioxygenase-like lactoylglutathione lyase family enzyme